jgi:hypothetical protein
MLIVLMELKIEYDITREKILSSDKRVIFFLAIDLEGERKEKEEKGNEKVEIRTIENFYIFFFLRIHSQPYFYLFITLFLNSSTLVTDSTLLFSSTISCYNCFNGV